MLRNLSFLFLFSLLVSCNTKTAKKIFNPNVLEQQVYTITVNKDTTIYTTNGAYINIPKGVIKAATPTVQLQVKEAYTIADIIKAGLLTSSEGRPLASGGMIFIDAMDKDAVKLEGRIGVSIPTAGINDDMQLFKGKTASSGNLDWQLSDTLNKQKQQTPLEAGEQLFKENCKSCHSVFVHLTGPALMGSDVWMPNREVLYSFIMNNQLVINAGSCYYERLYNQWNKSAMNTFTGFSYTDIDNIYKYIHHEVANAGISYDSLRLAYKKCKDSCELFVEQRYLLNNAKKELLKQGKSLVDNKVQIITTDTAGTIPKVTPSSETSLYYEFSISGFGWYNVDYFLNEKQGIVKSKLLVSLKGNYASKVQVYLIIPNDKVFQAGGLLEDGEHWGFYETDGSVILPQNRRAFIIVMGEEGDKAVFAKHEFYTSGSMQIMLEPLAVSIEKFNDEMRFFERLGLQSSLKDTPIADSLRTVDVALKVLDKLKPASCDCGCDDEHVVPGRPMTDTSFIK
ncbi:MAG: cytochrome c [Flavihumibacter sp.]|nr:cytochrome c [Flavihumibacter sp.]